ncbi:MAG: DUF2726 domain-containing protein [Betaproteobacteria bacterium]|nr:MAG: DUF2726 domain-containing protein [Betaproteobacteria bacterium]
MDLGAARGRELAQAERNAAHASPPLVPADTPPADRVVALPGQGAVVAVGLHSKPGSKHPAAATTATGMPTIPCAQLQPAHGGPTRASRFDSSFMVHPAMFPLGHIIPPTIIAAGAAGGTSSPQADASMSATSFSLTPLLLVIVIAGFVYAGVRVRRARADHRARSEERAAELLRAMRQQTARGSNASPAVEATAGGQPTARPQASAAAASATLARKPRLLSEHQRLLYLLLRAALPDYVIMASIRIADLVEPPVGQLAKPELEARMRRLLLERADCVVCDNDLVPLAALVVYENAVEKVPDEHIKVDALRELGVKFLRFRADSLPRPAEMRALVLG